MSPSATPATQNQGRCRQVPRLPRKVERHNQRPSAPKRATLCHQSQPSAISATPATQNEGGCESDWLVVPGCLSSLVSLHLFPNLAHSVRLFGCLPVHLSPSLTGWWCPAVCLHLSPYICFPSSFVSQSYWLVVPGCLSSLVFLHLFPNLAHGVRLFGCLPVHLSPSLTGWWCPAVCLHLSPYICFPIWLMVSGSSDVSQYICLPV